MILEKSGRDRTEDASGGAIWGSRSRITKVRNISILIGVMHSAEEFKHSEIFIRQEYDSVIK